MTHLHACKLGNRRLHLGPPVIPWVGEWRGSTGMSNGPRTARPARNTLARKVANSASSQKPAQRITSSAVHLAIDLIHGRSPRQSDRHPAQFRLTGL